MAGVFRGEKIIANWKLATDRQKTADEYGVLLKTLFRDSGLETNQIEAVVLSSVVPPVTGVFERMVAQYFSVHPLVIGPGVKTGLAFKYENPKR